MSENGIQVLSRLRNNQIRLCTLILSSLSTVEMFEIHGGSCTRVSVKSNMPLDPTGACFQLDENNGSQHARIKRLVFVT